MSVGTGEMAGVSTIVVTPMVPTTVPVKMATRWQTTDTRVKVGPCLTFLI